MKETMFFLAGMAFTIFAAATVAMYYQVQEKPEDRWTCEKASAEVMAMNACLQHRPTCIIPNGPEQFKIYHEARRYELDHCEER